ncbi:MAG: DUF5671 domain-containing protein [bacterium]|nr:DUF5671 domain-containing protein [bacterium]
MTTTSKPGPKEVVLQLFVIVTLYVIAVEVGILLHQLINAWISDVAADAYRNPIEYMSPLRHAIAMLIVFVPIHAWARRALHRLVDTSEAVRELRSRRWLGYFTIAIAALILAGDLVAVINRFLDGELTLRFGLKAIAILVIAAVVLWYERAELHRDTKPALHRTMHGVGIGALVVISVALVAGFTVAGAPRSARSVKIDEQRANHLMSIQQEIVAYWDLRRVRPARLEDLNDPIRGYALPIDPETGASYEYEVRGDLSFSLCGTFTTDTLTSATPTPQLPRSVYGDVTAQYWQHAQGRHCFERTIDPTRYPTPDFISKPPIY